MAPKAETLLAHLGRDPSAQHGAVNPPVYHASTILYETVDSLLNDTKPLRQGATQYGRAGTPTTFALESAVAELEGGFGAMAMPSGLAAISGALLSILKTGDHLLMADTVYYPTRALCKDILTGYGVQVDYFDPLVGGDVHHLIRDNTRAIFVESPGSLTFEVQDIPAIAQVAQQSGVLVMADNTWASPLYCNPLALGADLVVHAGTKYIVGHSDAMLGLIVAKTEALYTAVRLRTQRMGYTTGPDDLYLGLRGLRTLSVRLERHFQSALTLASWLQEQDAVSRVLYPALPDDPGHALWQRDFSGASGLLGLVLKPASKQAVAAFLEDLELFAMGYSWGGYESLLIPTFPETCRSATTWAPEGPCLRMHVGLEDPSDLRDDLTAGFARLRKTS
ncbi:MAG: cystathionine beta-lyase [Pseudomonadota bacterium]